MELRPQHAPQQPNKRTALKLALPIATGVLLTSLAIYKLACPSEPLMTTSVSQEQAKEQPKLAASGNVISNVDNAFESVFSKSAAVDTSILFDAISKAQDILLSTKAPDKKSHTLVIARLEGGRFAEFKTVTGERPDNGDACTVSERGNPSCTFMISRKPVSEDPGGIFSELSVAPQSNSPGEWVVLSALVRANSKALGDRHYIVCPYNEKLMSGQIAQAGVDFLAGLEAIAIKAVEKYSGRKDIIEKMGNVPLKVNLILALVEHTTASELGDPQEFANAVSRLLYHLALHKNQSKFLVRSSAGARGLFQFMPGSEFRLNKLYRHAPENSFNSWAKSAGYLPLAWLNKSNRLGDALYSSTLALFHHMDVLTTIEGWARSEKTIFASPQIKSLMSHPSKKKKSKVPRQSNLEQFNASLAKRGFGIQLTHSDLSRLSANGNTLQFGLITVENHKGKLLGKLPPLDPQSVLYSSPLQTICAVAAGYNGGPDNVERHIASAYLSGNAGNWHEKAFQHGIKNIAALDRALENTGYIVKATAIYNSINGGEAVPQEVARLIETSDTYKFNAVNHFVKKPKVAKPHGKHYVAPKHGKHSIAPKQKLSSQKKHKTPTVPRRHIRKR